MANIEANSMVSKALQAAEEADLLEEMAEQALQESEKALTQHLEDFPDSQFAE
jgi:soluble cytochrome b562